MRTRTLGFVIALIGVSGLVGCSLTRSSLRDAQFKDVATGGPMVMPKRCLLTFAILTRPARDVAIDQSIWSVADEQAIPVDSRMTLQANGFRVGVVTGDLPVEIERMLGAEGQNRVDPYQVESPDGGTTPVALAPVAEKASLFFTKAGAINGRTYESVQGYVNVSATQEGSAGLLLRIVPELHHGPIQRDWAAAPSPSPYAAQEIIRKEGQKEEAFRDLAMAVKILPNQTLVIGCLLDKPRSLGSFLLTEPELNSDRLKQKLLIIKGVRSNGSDPTLARTASATVDAAKKGKQPVLSVPKSNDQFE